MGNPPLTSAGRRAAGAALFAAVCAISCSHSTKEPGQLVIAVSTDMALPDQIDTIRLEVIVNGTHIFDNPMPVGGDEAQPIPATLTLVAGSDPTLPVTIRLSGQSADVVRTLRQVITTVPSEGTAMLRMPVQWLCSGKVKPVAGPDGGISYESECGADATCQAGKCVAAAVESATLPSYEPASVFGGGAAPSSTGKVAGACFDTIACLLTGTVAVPDDQCTLPLPLTGGATNVNVGLRVANDGICDTTGTTCFVPLDGSSAEGWTTQNSRIALPPAVCSDLREGLISGVVVSTSCATKLASTPPCGPWSSVTPAPSADIDAGDANAPLPTVPSLVASVLPEGSTSTACCPLMADDHALYTCTCDSSGTPQIVAIDPRTGTTTKTAAFKPSARRSRYAAVLAGGGVYWVDRSTSNGAMTCPVNQTAVSKSATSGQVAVVNGDVYDGADLLADATNLYALADNVAGLAAGAAAVQLLRIDPSSGDTTPFDTGGAIPVLQFAMDAKSVFVAVDTDEDRGDAGVQRISQVTRIPKAGGKASTIAQQTLNIADPTRGGFVGLADDGASLYAVYEPEPNSDGSVDLTVQKLGASSADQPTLLYSEKGSAPTTRLRLLGAVNGAVLLARDATQSSDAGAAESEGSVILIPPDGSTPRIVASFRGDTPIFELQAPAFSPDIFWLNQSGRVYRLSAPALK